MPGSYEFSQQATIDNDVFLCIVDIILRLSTVSRKRFIAMATKLLYVI